MASKNNAAELRMRTVDELSVILVDLKREQFNLRFQRATGQAEGTARMREVRREIARVKTLQHAHAGHAHAKVGHDKAGHAKVGASSSTSPQAS